MLLPDDLDRDAVRTAAQSSLRAPYVSRVSKRSIADAITALASAEREPGDEKTSEVKGRAQTAGR